MGNNSFSNDDTSEIVPLFPLPNVVLFPKAVLPLHIFEERYKVMTRDALAGQQQIALALLRPGWEKSYYGRPAIEPTVCIGRIVSSEELPDGRFNFLLQGVSRARVLQELPGPAEAGNAGKPYRIGLLRPLPEVISNQETVDAGRDALHLLFSESALGYTPLGRKFAELTQSALPTSDLADLISYNFVEDVAIKQQLLGEPDLSRRLPILLDALGATARPTPSASVRMFKRPSVN